MSTSTRRARLSATLTTLGLSAVLALCLGAPSASADDADHGEDQITITVTIPELDECALSSSGCHGGDGALASTGSSIGIPIGAGVLAGAVGAAVVLLSRRRRRVINN